MYMKLFKNFFSKNKTMPENENHTEDTHKEEAPETTPPHSNGEEIPTEKLEAPDATETTPVEEYIPSAQESPTQKSERELTQEVLELAQSNFATDNPNSTWESVEQQVRWDYIDKAHDSIEK